ncbi:PREDICTED: methyltransferase-like protein 6 isoform X1 [Lupinus angustifolius]|uniref:methyltransferase-like protein 6 isoform X1 n=1 Tax=Lupinus angustifolius TaxID=3871 RepID=UPI00092F54C1|nr:PREDICTED: methyltransferase-like protein 6 isoform X1 [Lupinus angustifolius]
MKNEELRMSCESEIEAEYFNKDFDWEELRAEVESNPSFHYHFLPFQSSNSQSHSSQTDVDAWNQFHTRHSSGKFFKERRYLLKEFPELLHCGPNSKLLEIGCGNGSTVLPILRANKDVVVYACDCSNETLERAKEIISATKVVSYIHRFHTFCCDLSTDGFPNWLAWNPCQGNFLQKHFNCFSDVKADKGQHFTNSYSSQDCDTSVGGVDFVTLIFTLSAVPLERMPRSIKECFTVLKPGGTVLFRDYGLYDMTMLRFEPEKRVGFREYMRSDGTRSYFFCLDTVRNLFVDAGFTVLELDYCCVKSVNRRKGKSMRRVWVHGKFQKPTYFQQ